MDHTPARAMIATTTWTIAYRLHKPRRCDRAAASNLELTLAAVCVVMLATAMPALASVRALPGPQEAPIERSTLHPSSPKVSAPDDSSQEKMLQKLRQVAQRANAGLTSKERAPSVRIAGVSGDIKPPDAAWLLGLLALHGLAMPADLPQAQQWFERAQMLGHPLAPAGLAWCQISGCVTAPNPAAALHWIALVRRVDLGLAKYLEWHASMALAPLTEPRPQTPDRYPGSLAPPPSSADLQKLLTQAVRAGSAQARNEWALELLASGDLEEALAQFQAASAHSEAAAANASLLASRIKSSSTVHARSARYSAADWYAEARRYHRGDGVPANYTEAVRLYQIAASSGDPQARKMLELIFSHPAPDGSVDIAWMQQLAVIEVGPSGFIQAATATKAPSGWQRDPSPLYEWVPPQWRQTTLSTTSPR